MQILSDATGAVTPEEVLQKYGESIEQVVKASTDPYMEWERLRLLNQAKQSWLMVKGNHSLIPGNVDSGMGQIVDWITTGATEDETGADAKLCPPINVIGGDCYKYMSVMGAAAPRVKGVADDPSDPDSIKKAQDADANIRDLWIKNQMDRVWKVLPFHQYVTGPVYLRGVWNLDRRKYGQTVEPSIELATDEMGNTVPMEGTEPKVYVNGDAEVRFYSVLEVTHPFMAKTLHECNYFTCESLQSKWDLLDAFPDGPLEEYRNGDVPDDDLQPSSVTANEVREATANPSGVGRAKRPDQWRFREAWLAPALFQAIEDKEKRALFQQTFPDGLYLARVGKIKVKCENRALTDEWTVCRVGRGEKILERPISADFVPIQRAINDLVGMGLETTLRAIPQTLIDSTLLNIEAFSKKDAVPNELIPVMSQDGDMQKKVYQVPPTRMSDQHVPFLELLVTTGRDITAIRPEISGGGAPTQTFREYKTRKDAAMAVLAPQADEMRFAAEDIAKILVKLRAKYGSGTVKAQRKSAFGIQTDVVDMASLSETGWHAEADDNFPMNLADRWDRMWALLKEFPEQVWQAMGILDPLNIEQTNEILQVPGYANAIVEQLQKTLGDIRQLLQEQPVNEPGPDGQPGQPQPSMKIDPYDNHQVVADFVAKWLISSTGQQMKNENPAGYANVEAFQAAHMAAAQPPQPPPTPALRGNLNLSAKLEDFPGLIPEAMQGAGLPAPPPQAAAPVPPPEPPQDLGAPSPVEHKESPLPESGPEAPEVPTA